jgi:short-subunit dehydrogenase
MKTHSLSEQVIVIIGASGGLGGAIARHLSQAGARLVLAGRNQTTLQTLAGSLFGDNLTAQVDLTSPESLDALCRKTMEHFGRVDAVIDAGGMDIRKPFLQHTPEEMDRIVRLDLLGPMLVTRTFLPVMKMQGSGQIVLVGGFGNGRLSFPYFTADVAARAGLATFVETINRELTLEGIPVTVTFFSPEPAHTEAERPYFDLWRDININIAPSEKVAEEMVITLMKQEQVHIMGGWSTKLFGVINDLFPRIFGKIFLSLYGEKIKNYLGKEAHEPG